MNLAKIWFTGTSTIFRRLYHERMQTPGRCFSHVFPMAYGWSWKKNLFSALRIPPSPTLISSNTILMPMSRQTSLKLVAKPKGTIDVKTKALNFYSSPNQSSKKSFWQSWRLAHNEQVRRISALDPVFFHSYNHFRKTTQTCMPQMALYWLQIDDFLPLILPISWRQIEITLHI